MRASFVIPAGSMFTLTYGEHSDFTVCALFRAKGDLNIEEIIARFKSEKGMPVNDDHVFEPDFVSWLSTKDDLIEPVSRIDWNFGSYGMFDHEGADLDP